jgi:hypothetical protein
MKIITRVLSQECWSFGQDIKWEHSDYEASTVIPRFMRGLHSVKTSHKLKSHISNALTYREKRVACNNVKYNVSNVF